MESKKTNKKIVAVLIIIIICLVVGGGFVLYKVLSDAPNSNLGNTENKNEHLTGNENNTTDWINYLTNQNLTLTKSVWDNAKDECVYKKIELSTNDIKTLLTEFNKNKITKYYYGTTPPTGTTCSDRYKIEYNNKTINLESDGIMWVNDDALSSKIDLEVDETTGTVSNEYVYKLIVLLLYSILYLSEQVVPVGGVVP